MLKAGEHIDHENIRREITELDLLRDSMAPLRVVPVLAEEGHALGAAFGFLKVGKNLYALVVVRQEVALKLGTQSGRDGYLFNTVTSESRLDPTRQGGTAREISGVVMRRNPPGNHQTCTVIKIASPAEIERADLNRKNMRTHATIAVLIDVAANFDDFKEAAVAVYNKRTEYGLNP